MNYYKDKTNKVFGYDDDQLAQISRLNELENLIPPLEVVLIDAKNSLHHAEVELNQIQDLLEQEMSKQVPVDIEDSDGWQKEHDKLIARIELSTNTKLEVYNENLSAFNQAKFDYQPLKNEYDAILPIFFDIREKLKLLKKMTSKEVDAHLNPPISKEKLIDEAEVQRQIYANEAEKNITILERKARLGMATEADKNNLIEWEIYSIKVSDIDTSTAPDIVWPEKP